MVQQPFNLSIIPYFRNNPNAILVFYFEKLIVGKHVFLRNNIER
jgi:hypothetical protein